MTRINPQDLKKILELHRKWVLGEEGGEIADLSRADLSHANLRDADLRYADLRRADLSHANLGYASLRDANLRYADLSHANLGYASLRDANLRYADLSHANLGYASLRDANLRDADLRRADLSHANLGYASLRDANLRDADLRRADLSKIKADLYKVLESAKSEVPGLYKAILDGKISGSQYEGECACLVGTIANIQHTNYQNIDGLKPNSERLAEKWFLGISKGDMPENSAISKLTAEWILEYMTNNGIEIPKRSVVWS